MAANNPLCFRGRRREWKDGPEDGRHFLWIMCLTGFVSKTRKKLLPLEEKTTPWKSGRRSGDRFFRVDLPSVSVHTLRGGRCQAEGGGAATSVGEGVGHWFELVAAATVADRQPLESLLETVRLASLWPPAQKAADAVASPEASPGGPGASGAVSSCQEVCWGCRLPCPRECRRAQCCGMERG